MACVACFALSSLLLSSCWAADFGLIHVNGNGGAPTQLHLTGDEWQRQFIHVEQEGEKLSLCGGGGLQVSKTASAGTDDDHAGYYQWKLLGKALSYTVNLSNVGCSCNAALYFVSMPGYNVSSGSTPDPRSRYYCGANAGKPSTNTSAAGGRGNYCPEMDVLEANRFAAQMTAHICNGTNRGSGFYPMCDWHGCATAVYNQSKTAMCPDTSCTIDTRQPFRHTVSFPLDHNGRLMAINNVFVQQHRTFSFGTCVGNVNAGWTHGNSKAYLQAMQANLERGMVLDISLWGVSNQGMSWLDGPTGCKGDCNVRNSSVSFSELTLDVL